MRLTSEGHNFKPASQNIVQNKAKDLIDLKYKEFTKCKKQADDNKELRIQWYEKMKNLEKQGLEKQEIATLTFDKKKLQDLDYLKNQTPTGPFTSVEVDLFMSTSEEPARNKRLYIEVRYAKYSTTKIKRSSAIFRLKKNGKSIEP